MKDRIFLPCRSDRIFLPCRSENLPSTGTSLFGYLERCNQLGKRRKTEYFSHLYFVLENDMGKEAKCFS